jgi:DnaJ domain
VALFSFEIDPHRILGVTPQATLAEIREAYRQKAKVHHPDAGGEDWAFRIVVQAYEMLSSARVARATHAEPERPARSATAAPRLKPKPSPETVHQGIRDSDVEPAQLVALELLCVRYLWDDADYLWLTQRVPDEERFLSCSLNLSWPDQTSLAGAGPISDHAATITILQEIFDHMIITSRAVSSRARVEDDRFGGWLSYSSFDRAWKAVTTIHELLRSRGLGLRQWSRDLFIPRGWR